MAKTTVLQTNFSSGEISPLLDGRVDVGRYYNAAKTLENFIILPYGGIIRRPGTVYVASAADSARKSRLITFQFSVTQAYIVEFADRELRFYADHGQIQSGGSAYSISSPYLEADLFDLQVAQDADTMWIVHPSYKPRKLTRNALTWDSYTKLMLHMDGADGSTTFTDETGKTMTAVGTAQIDTAQYVFNGASGLFDGNSDYLTTPDHADWDFGTGDFTIDFRVRFNANGADQTVISAYDGTDGWLFKANSSDNFQFIHYSGGTINITMSGTGGSLSQGEWYHIAIVRSGNTFTIYKNGVSLAATTDTDSCDGSTDPLAIGVMYKGGAPQDYFNGWIDELRISKGIARWTANFTPPASAYAADVITFALNNYAPTADPFGADGSDDCPSSVAIYEQRIFFANTNNNPQKIWGSVSGDFNDMTTGSGDTAALTYVIGSQQVNAIRWLSSGRVLEAGTYGGVFIVSSGSDELPLTPSNVNVKKRTSYGAKGIVPERIGDYSYYVQRNAKTIREFTGGANFDSTSGEQSESSFDATILAEHITGSAIMDMAYQQSPYNLLWCVRSDGKMAIMTRQVNQEVLAWSRIVLGGSFGSGNAVVESVAVIPGDGGDDEVWITVKRTIDSATARYIEYFKPMDFGDEQGDAFFVDSGLSLDTAFTITAITKANPGVVTTSGSHSFSNGDIVIIRGVKGMTEVNRTKFKVANKTDNTFELTDTDGNNVDTSSYAAYSSDGEVRKCVTSISGLSHLEGEAIDVCVDGVDGTASAVSSGASTILSPSNGGGEIHAGLSYTSTLKTVRMEAGAVLGTAQSKLKRINKTYAMLVDTLKMNMGNDSTLYAVTFSGTTLFTGWKSIMFPSVWDRDGYIKITQSKPLPLTLLAIAIYITTSES